MGRTFTDRAKEKGSPNEGTRSMKDIIEEQPIRAFAVYIWRPEIPRQLREMAADGRVQVINVIACWIDENYEYHQKHFPTSDEIIMGTPEAKGPCHLCDRPQSRL